MKICKSIQIALVAGLIGALSLGLGVPVANAQERESMTLSPTDRSYTVEPGEVITDEFIVLNDGQTPYVFNVYATPYSVSGERYDPNFIDKLPTSDAFEWIQFDTVTWQAGVRETVKVPFTMRVPKDATPGGHYGVIFAETQPRSDAGSVIRKKRLGMVLYVSVKGDAKLAGETKSIAIEQFQSQAPIRATIDYANTGNVHYTSKQSLKVSDVFGKAIYVHTQDVAVLPNKPRVVSLEWSGAKWLGLYKVNVASTAVDKTTTKESYVLVAPIWFLVLVIVMVSAGVVYAIRGKRTKRR